MAEFGVYGQILPTVGLAIGYDTKKGVTFSYFRSVNAGHKQ